MRMCKAAAKIQSDMLPLLYSGIVIVLDMDLCYGGSIDSNDVPCIPKESVSSMKRGEKEPVQVRCPRCGRHSIVYLPLEDLPRCPDPACKGVRMVIEELLDEGKSY